MRITPRHADAALAAASSADFERRGLPDRRREPTPILSRHSFAAGRRRGLRRAGDELVVGYFVDQWGGGLFLVVTCIAALNFFDAWFTIYFLSWGGTEMNPLIDAVLQWGTWPFIIVKSVGIGVCIAVLTVTSRFKIARVGLGLVLLGYSLLLAWHFHLLGMVPL